MAEVNLTQQELDERIAILNRFRTLLVQQRDKFREYLKTLEAQEKTIGKADTEKMLAQTELEQQILASIQNLRKVSLPMEKLYETAFSGNIDSFAKDKQIPNLQAELQTLQDKVLAQNEKNRNLLKENMAILRTQINRARTNPYQNSRVAYSSNRPTSTIIDVEA